MVETRLRARGRQLDYDTAFPVSAGMSTVAQATAFQVQRNDPSRALLGERQMAWLTEAMAESRQAGRPWQLLGRGNAEAGMSMGEVISPVTSP